MPQKESGNIKIKIGDSVVFDEKFSDNKELKRLIFAMNNKPLEIIIRYDDAPIVENKNAILQICANIFGVGTSEILEGICKPNVVKARSFYWRIIRSNGATFEECAEDTGHRSYQAVMIAIRKIKKEIQESDELYEKWQSVKYLCGDKTRTRNILNQTKIPA